MSLLHFLFSFEGRVRRRDFWLFFLFMIFCYGGLVWALSEHVYTIDRTEESFGIFYGMHVVRHNFLVSLLGLAALWAKLAVTVKRWHDRDKSGWWILINLVPVIGWVWQVIECGFFDGSPGPNRFGPSPKMLERAA